jgi:hypothetical protein
MLLLLYCSQQLPRLLEPMGTPEIDTARTFYKASTTSGDRPRHDPLTPDPSRLVRNCCQNLTRDIHIRRILS